MKRYVDIISWISGIALLLVLMAFSSQREKELRIKGLDIQIDYSNAQYFVNKQEVTQIVQKEYPYLDSLYERDININLLEESIDNHPSIRKAEVYSALDGILRIRVHQKKPLFRVHNSQRDFYITEQGDTMGLSPNFSAEVPLVTGLSSAKNEQAIFHFFSNLKKDDFYKDFFTGLNVEADSTWTLYPRPGHHKVLLGKPENIDTKLQKLETFYKKVVDRKNLDSIASLNLAYDKQVVCIKH